MILTIKFSIQGLPVYPHIKLTREEFPRLLATRIVTNTSDEYFGAFLTKTSVRILIDFLNRTFRLRSCDIEIDGSFPLPCTQYFAKRCVAPCVSSLCSEEFHQEIADLARIFLRNERELFVKEISRKIEAASDDLDYETAAFWRDILNNVETYWSKPRWQVWLEDAVDTYEIEVMGDTIRVYLITQRGRHVIGSHVFEFDCRDDAVSAEAVSDVIRQFYTHYLPREIRIPARVPGRRELAESLQRRFGRAVRITTTNPGNRRASTVRALVRSRNRVELENATPRKTVAEIQMALRGIFELKELPKRIEAFDIAHISATGFAGGMSVWEEGEMRPELFRHWLSDESSELDALRFVVGQRYAEMGDTPTLLLIDGGRSHLKAAVGALEMLPDNRLSVISVVKPRGKHSSVSHFLTEEGRRIEFDPSSEAHLLLQTLRDEAHDLANAVHRESRDMLHFYERRGVKPLIVPIRFMEKGGQADDLRPIVTCT